MGARSFSGSKSLDAAGTDWRFATNAFLTLSGN